MQDGEYCDVTFDWRVAADKPLLRRFSFLLRPLFEANHKWAMEQGRRSLELELERYRASTVEEMNRIAPAPRPEDLFRADIFAGAVLSLAVMAAIWKAPQ
jgi:hypothetical protein